MMDGRSVMTVIAIIMSMLVQSQGQPILSNIFLMFALIFLSLGIFDKESKGEKE